MLSDFSATSSDLTRSIFHTVATIYNSFPYARRGGVNCRKTPLSEDQAKALLLLVKRDLNAPERQNAAFSLVRMVLSRKLMISEVYDLMDELSVMLLQSFSESTRNQCARVLLVFILNYPMSDKRIEKTVSFLLKNIEYDEPSGRLAVLNLLYSMLKAVPEEVRERVCCDV